ncbi:MAG: Ig-like domain-containing protein, partial [Rikenellaceae bacterium]|nr:Ig-like domain-containing protein [Rikenellaceae bacterium]
MAGKQIFKLLFTRMLPVVSVGATLWVLLFSNSCANTTTPPSGGPKDTIPPVIRKVDPLEGATMVPVKKTKITFTFNEYVVVKDPSCIYLSPPLEKRPKYRIHNKSLIVTFESDLDSNRTYTLDLTGAVADNNEGNMFPGYTYVFSTGERIDSMMITGTVQDCNTLKPVKGATVMLYKDQADSAVFLQRPVASAKTDDWGFFCIRNIQDTVYRLYAVKDENGNNKYDPETDRIAFFDSLIRPSVKVRDSLPELMKYDMKDTLCCLARNSEYTLNMFKEDPSKQMIVNKERVGERTAYITFMAPYAQIDSIWIDGVPPEKLITQFNIRQDSLEIWVNDPRKQPDTLFLNVKYMKTDTTGFLSDFTEVVKLTMPRKNANAARKSSRKDIKKEDTLCVFTVDAKPENIEQYGFQFEFKYPIVTEAFDSIVFKSVNPKQQEKVEQFDIEKDSLNLRKFTLRPRLKYLQGYEYKMHVPHRKFRDINGFWNDSLDVKVSLPNDDKLSLLKLKMTSVKNKYIVDLLNEKRDNVLRSFIIDT